MNECDECDGEGSYTTDRATGSGEHTTIERPCPACGGTGETGGGVGLGPDDDCDE